MYLTITPSFRKESSHLDADGNRYPVGDVFEYDGKISDLREKMPGYEITQEKKPDAPDDTISIITNAGDEPEKGAA